MRTVTIGKTKYNVKYTIRALFIFEQIANKPFSIDKTIDNFIFFYSMILANNQDKTPILDWNDFLDAVDKDPSLMKVYYETLADEAKMNNMMSNGEEKKADNNKKK